MLFYVIPLLVLYVPEFGQWKYGPEHVFKAEFHNIRVHPTDSGTYSEVYINFTCRPMNMSLMQCRTENGTMDMYEVAKGGTPKKLVAHYDDFGIENVLFQVQFDKVGITRMWFLNDASSDAINMIRAAIGTMNSGQDMSWLAGRDLKDYVGPEKSVIGTCSTKFNIGREHLTEDELENEPVLEGFTFIVPTLGHRSDNKTIVIEKDRNVSDCKDTKMRYVFGSSEEDDAKTGRKIEKHIRYSRSKMLLHKKYFSAFTETLGTIADGSGKKSENSKSRALELVRVSLQSIREATETLWNARNGIEAGMGFDRGAPWPEQVPE